MPLSARDMAKSYTVPDGELQGVEFTLLCFKSAYADVVASDLRRSHPPFEYIHTDRRRQTDEPDDLRAERESIEKKRQQLLDRATALNVAPDAKKLAALVVKSDWKERRLWNTLHDIFCVVESITTSIVVPDDTTSPEAKALRWYWENRDPITEDRWRVFERVLGVNVYNAWWEAYVNTRSTEAPAPPELNEEKPTDPKD